MENGKHSEQPNPDFTEHAGKLGPDYVAVSCISCHANNGRALPPTLGQRMGQSVVKVAGADGDPHAVYGATLQTASTEQKPEGRIDIARYELIDGRYGDGTRYQLRKPIYRFQGQAPARFSVRLTPQLVGLGLLEAIPEAQILALADPQDRDGNGISGRAHRVNDIVTGKPRLGRFGYRASQPTVRAQIASAFQHDMGVTTTSSNRENKLKADDIPEVSDQELADLARYVSLLGVPARRNLEDPKVALGEKQFLQANCHQCHIRSLTTSPYHPFAELREQNIQPFTDLLLHDMGTGLADNLTEGDADGKEWRTPPLWGIGLTQGVSGGEAFLHDGRARTLAEAILWHDGEAKESKENFRNMAPEKRAALIKFLRSL